MCCATSRQSRGWLTNYTLCGPSSTKLRIMNNSRGFLSWQVRSFLRLEFALRVEQTAVIKEALRISTAVPAGLPRIVPPSGVVISGVKIPGGVCALRLFVIVSYLIPVDRPLLARAPFSCHSQKKYLLGRTSLFPIGGFSQDRKL